MDSMDVKGIAWVGNIYQKFEAMCLEVEEAMCQETAKYVENQVQTMGASMKRFCSDVMQDLLPPSSKDLSKVASAELLLNPYLEFGIHMKPVSNFKEDAKDSPVHVKGVSEGKMGICEDKSNSSYDGWEDWSAASFNWEISDKDDAKCDQMTMEGLDGDREGETRGEQEGHIGNLAVDSSFASTLPAKTVSTNSSKKGEKGSRLILSSNIIKAECRATCELVSQASSNASSGQFIDGDVSHSGRVVANPCESSSHVSVSEMGPHDSQNTECGQFLSLTEISADQSDENNNTSVQETEAIIGDESESGFEETCVLVDGNDYHYHPTINHKQEIKRSYKKKLQGAFTLKKKSTRKQEYKQLATQYNNLNIPSNIINDSLESEWEIL